MENLDDFRKTGYTKNLFEAKVAQGFNQLQNKSNLAPHRKSSHRYDDEEDEDEEIVRDKEEII